MNQAGTAGGEAEHPLEASTSSAASGAVALLPTIGAADSAFQVEVVSSLKGLEAVASDWLLLESLSPAAAVFQSFAHIRIWAHHFVEGKHGGARLDVVIVRDRDRPVLILPTVSSRLPGLRIARIAGDPVGQYADVLIDPSRATRAAFDTAIAALKQRGVAAIVLRRVRDDSALLRLAAPYLRPPVAQNAAPFVELSGFADFPAYRRALPKRVRQTLRSRRHHLEKAGEFKFEILRGAEARTAVAEAMDLKRKWMVQRGNVSSAFVDPATRACLLDLAESAESGAVVMRLSIGGKTAAIRYGFEYRGTHFAYLNAYDEAFANLSPGKLLMEYCVSGFSERAIGRIDMLPPAGAHKSDWCPEAVGVADYTLPLSRAGCAYAEIYWERFRPTLKKTFERMPASLRSLAAALFVRI